MQCTRSTGSASRIAAIDDTYGVLRYRTLPLAGECNVAGVEPELHEVLAVPCRRALSAPCAVQPTRAESLLPVFCISSCAGRQCADAARREQKHYWNGTFFNVSIILFLESLRLVQCKDGAQLAVDTCTSPVIRSGEPQPGADFQPGLALLQHGASGSSTALGRAWPAPLHPHQSPGTAARLCSRKPTPSSHARRAAASLFSLPRPEAAGAVNPQLTCRRSTHRERTRCRPRGSSCSRRLSLWSWSGIIAVAPSPTHFSSSSSGSHDVP